MERDGGQATASGNVTEPSRGSVTPAAVGPGTRIGRFEVRRLVGEGTMGRLYLARDIMLGRSVALKLLHGLGGATRFDRLVAEASSLAACDHPNIVRVYEAGHDGRHPYIAREYVDGGTLRDRLASESPTTREAIRILLDIARALQEAHARGLVHCDLKPGNVVVSREGRVCVVDFGLARRAEPDLGGAAEGRGSGTPAYMAPEQWQRGGVTPATDLWALGVIAYEMLAGQRPFEATGGRRPLRARVLDPALPAPPLDSGREALDQLVAACLRKEAPERPSAAEAAARLERCLADFDAGRGDDPPFRGLEPFDERHAADFRGRDRELDACLERLREQPVVVVVGPSGAGKSSFVAAGVLPRLDDRVVLRVRPGERPFLELARRLRWHGAEGRPATLAARLQSSPTALSLELNALAARAGRRVLLFVDQLEELYVQVPDGDVRRRFAAALAGAADDVSDPVRVVCTLRDDFLGAAAESPALRRALERPFVLRAPGPEALREAIVEPLRRAGGRFDDPALVDEMLAAVEGEPACLPLLQFTCRELWDAREGDLLRRARYEAIGGVAGSLAAHADRVFDGLGSAERRGARRVFERLVTPERTRRRVRRADLAEPPHGEAVVERLLRARLLVATPGEDGEGPLVELVHESLIRHWARFRGWIEESHEERALLDDLDLAVRQWERTGAVSLTAGRDLRRRADALALELPPRARALLEAVRRRERRLPLVVAGAFAVLVLALGAVGLVAARNARRASEAEAERALALARVEQVLAEADVGRFVLELVAYDWDAERRVPTFADPGATPLRWTLHRAPEQGAEAAGALEHNRAPGPAPDTWVVEAPSGPAVLRVERGPCPPSWIPVRRLPGYSARRADEPPALRLQVPTCAASAADMVEVPAGPYRRDPPEGEVHVAAFRIDRTEVSNAAYRLFSQMSATTGDPPPEYPTGVKPLAAASLPDHPVTAIDRQSAAAYCRFLGKRLPTADEWWKAARGGLTLDGGRPNPDPRRPVPWLGAVDPVPANLGGLADGYLTTAPVDAFPEGASPYGVLNLAGNVYEWTAPPDPEAGLARILGGSWESPPELGHHHIGHLNRRPPRLFSFDIGFRCVSDVR